VANDDAGESGALNVFMDADSEDHNTKLAVILSERGPERFSVRGW
jgi:hypothetical protein